ncbi:MAG: L-lactate permease [Caulobacteraceae bacterium]
MFHQLLTPIGGSLPLSFLVAALPVAVVLVMLGVMRRPAWQASLAGVIVALIIAVGLWKMPLGLALDSTAAGMTFAVWPVMWIVFNALILYNITVKTGRFEDLRRWIVEHIPGDKRVVLVVIGFCFGALLEGVAGFGTTVAICSSLLIALGFSTLDALTFSLIFDTAPVAFGALGVPVTTLGTVTGLPAGQLGAMIGRQLPFMAMLLPFYVTALFGGLKSIKATWPVLVVAGASFSLTQFASSNLLDYTLTDVLSALISLLATVFFLKFWRPEPDPAYAVHKPENLTAPKSGAPTWQAWLPWIGLSLVVILWTTFKVAAIGDMKIPWPGLDKQVFITLYNKPYAAVWDFQPLATGTAILVSAIITSAFLGVGPKGFLSAAWTSWKQIWLAVVTVSLIVGLAYLMNYSGLTYTLGMAAASVGPIFPLLSAFLGWLAVFLSGSDTSGNALFGNLQVVAAKQLGLSPVLMAATNSSGGVMGKMISPQNIATGVAVTDLKGKEGVVLARTFKHSIILTVILGLLVMAQQYLFPWMIP